MLRESQCGLGSETLALLYPSCVNLGKLLALSELDFFLETVSNTSESDSCSVVSDSATPFKTEYIMEKL